MHFGVLQLASLSFGLAGAEGYFAALLRAPPW